MLTALAFCFALTSMTGCGGTEPLSASDEEAAHGCRFTCPKCHKNEVCPKYACVEDCSPPHQPCIDNMMCPVDYSWSSKDCSCEPNKP
jgi:hypothetical protein